MDSIKKYLSTLAFMMILCFIIISCERTSVNDFEDEGTEIIKISPKDVKHLPPPPSIGCDPMVTDLIACVEDFSDPGSGTVVGQVLITNDANYLYIEFKLDQDAIDEGYYLKKVMAWIHRQYSGKSFIYEQNLVSHPVDYYLTIPKNLCDVYKCGAILDIVAKAIVCKSNGPVGEGGPCLLDCTDIKLMAGQTSDAGQLLLEIVGDNLVVTYQTENGWELLDVKLAVYNDCNLIPVNNPGHPQIGQFPYKAEDLEEGTTEYTFEIPLDELGIDCDEENPYLCIAAHADVKKGSQQETAWGIAQCEGFGEKFTTSGWAEHFNVFVDCNCDNFGDPGDEDCCPAWAYGPRRTVQFLDPGQDFGWKLSPLEWCCE